jgi:hypothetical protein
MPVIATGVEDGNAQENVLAWPSLMRPSLRLGCALQQLLDPEADARQLQASAVLRTVKFTTNALSA